MCSLAEAKQIVETVEYKLSEGDQLDQTITTSLQQAEALRQSILKKAFSGQLVPQDPHDEPASVLLARIRAARESATRKPAATGRRTRKAAA
jgi:type I restriction enzyme S subunit